jgi:hypothetical protein
MKLKLALLVGLFAFGYAMSAAAGAVTDTDADLVPDQFDNCRLVANGPNQGTNQVDGYGNRCDTDYDNSLTTTTADFGAFLATFGTNNLGETDHDGSGTITTADFGIFLGKFSATPGAPGPSGLACASGTATACTP